MAQKGRVCTSNRNAGAGSRFTYARKIVPRKFGDVLEGVQERLWLAVETVRT